MTIVGKQLVNTSAILQQIVLILPMGGPYFVGGSILELPPPGKLLME